VVVQAKGIGLILHHTPISFFLTLIILTKVDGKSNMCDKFSQKSCLILHHLYEVINQRRQYLPSDSYTTSLFLGGTERIITKFSEESQELIDAVASISPNYDTKTNQEHIIHEAADLVYLFFVLLASCNVTLSDVEQELAKRFGVSGLAEKAARK